MRFVAIGLLVVMLAMPAKAQTETRPTPTPPAEATVAAGAEGGLSTGALVGIAAATAFIIADAWYGFPLFRSLQGYAYRLIYPPPPPPTPAQTMRVMAIVAGAVSGVIVRAYHTLGGTPAAEDAPGVEVNTSVQG